MTHKHDLLPELSDLEWQAFRFLANELNDADRSAFEKQLEHDETAQDSLVQMSIVLSQLATAGDLNQTVRETPEVFNVSDRVLANCAPRRRTVAAWVFTVASILLAGLATWAFYNTGKSTDDGSRLADAWIESVGGMTEEAESDFELAKDELSDFSNGDEEGWLLAALISLDDVDRELIQ